MARQASDFHDSLYDFQILVLVFRQRPVLEGIRMPWHVTLSCWMLRIITALGV